MKIPRVAAAMAAAVSLAIGACSRQEGGSERRVPATTGSFVDNGDGTVTDSSTGLMWEKKCDCPGTPHHFDTNYFWSAGGAHETIWDWLDAVNKEGAHGFAGHGDWRVPNVKELVSLVDYECSDPAVAPLFAACEEACSDAGGAGCGCTAPGPYWTSTTFADFPAHALVVGFALGGVDDQLKTLPGYVRAVRGPLPGNTEAAGPQGPAPPSQ